MRERDCRARAEQLRSLKALLCEQSGERCTQTIAESFSERFHLLVRVSMSPRLFGGCDLLVASQNVSGNAQRYSRVQARGVLYQILLRDRGFRYAGFVPDLRDADVLRLQYLDVDVDTGIIQLYTDEARDLLAFTLADEA